MHVRCYCDSELIRFCPGGTWFPTEQHPVFLSLLGPASREACDWRLDNPGVAFPTPTAMQSVQVTQLESVRLSEILLDTLGQRHMTFPS